jgi:glutamate racemase
MISSGAIGVFDSGVGGLNVLTLLKHQFPNENFIYFADNANLPYGDKTEEEIIKFSKNIVNFLISKKVKLIVVPCNTSSAISIEQIRNYVSIPIIDIITPITSEISKQFKRIALIATKGTVSSNAYLKELLKCNPNIELIQIACPKLVPIIENNKIDAQETIDILNDYLKPIIEKDDLEALIYGCTHYQYLDNIIRNLIPKNITILSPDNFICKDIEPYASHTKQIKRKTEYYVSGDKKQFLKAGKLFTSNIDIKDIKKPQYIKNPVFLESKNFLTNELKGFSVLYFKKIDSTNDKAIQIIEKQLYKKPTLIIADLQIKGRGKGSSEWISSIGNVAFTLLYEIKRPMEDFQNFSLVVGLSLLETISENKINTQFDIKIKYPNDILINGKKVAGILIDVHRMHNENYIAIGVGINWHNSPLPTSDKIEDIIKVSKNKFIIELVYNINIKVINPINFELYIDQKEKFKINLGQYSEKIMENIVII